MSVVHSKCSYISLTTTTNETDVCPDIGFKQKICMSALVRDNKHK